MIHFCTLARFRHVKRRKEILLTNVFKLFALFVEKCYHYLENPAPDDSSGRDKRNGSDFT